MNSVSQKIAELRVLIGYIGEKDQANWWGSEFYSSTATSFLTPIFNRSLFLARFQGANAAASKVHDEFIGIGRINHLFRLPIGLEQTAAEALNDSVFVDSLKIKISSRENALSHLAALAQSNSKAQSGPIAIGLMSEELDEKLIYAASLYHAAFEAGIKTFPYLRDVE